MTAKYSSNDECDALKAKLRLERAWNFEDEAAFLKGVTEEGRPFFGFVPTLTTHEWSSQTLVGVDFDKYTHASPREVVNHYKRLGFNPWFAYETWSGPSNFRLVFKVDEDTRYTYKDWHMTIRLLQGFGGVGVDKAPTEPTRCWQGVYGKDKLLYLAKEGFETRVSPKMFNHNSFAVRGKGTFKSRG